jgi:hypothetical protein
MMDARRGAKPPTSVYPVDHELLIVGPIALDRERPALLKASVDSEKGRKSLGSLPLLCFTPGGESKRIAPAIGFSRPALWLRPRRERLRYLCRRINAF